MSPNGVVRPDTRLLGRTNPAAELAACDARLLGLLGVASGLKPKDMRLAERGGSMSLAEGVGARATEVLRSRDEKVLAPVLVLDALARLRDERTVTVDGIEGILLLLELLLAPPRGDARGGVVVGAGSLERAVCTRCSSFCIFPISPRIWWSERELVVGIRVDSGGPPKLGREVDGRGVR